MDMEDLVLELIQRLDVIDALPDEVAGIVVQSKVARVSNTKQLILSNNPREDPIFLYRSRIAFRALKKYTVFDNI